MITVKRYIWASGELHQAYHGATYNVNVYPKATRALWPCGGSL
jgi:hypothetical protein